MSIRTINPSTGETLREFRLHTDADVEEFVSEGDQAFHSWRKTDMGTRFDCLIAFEEALLGAKQALGEQISQEMGKMLPDAISEVEKCAASCKTIRENFIEWKAHHETMLPTGHHVTREPMGLLLGIMPWNFPVWQVVRFVAPALLCGNTILLKHAPNTWGVAEFLDDLFAQTFPHASYANLKVDVPWVPRLIEDRRVRGVSITGSRRAGSSVGQVAGANLKKCVLELGGSDAYVVLDDADLELAADICVKSRLLNAGQSCVSAKRFIVTSKNVGEFTERMRAGLASKKPGDPFETGVDFGPLARRDLRDQLHEQVTTSVSQGANLELGGKIPDRAGFFYPASLLTGVKRGQVAFEEELFGPVASIIEAEDEKDAVRIANSSRYGLGGAVFSRDENRAALLARNELDSGMIAVNDFVRSDALAPFGGVKDSGLGRELGRDGCFEFTNIKTVFTKPN